MIGFGLGIWDCVSAKSRTLNPESRLSLSNTFAPGVNFQPSVTMTPPVVWAVDFAGLTVADGSIWNSGGPFTGAGLYIRGGNIYLRAGNGGAEWPESNVSYIIATAPTGDGTLVWEMNSSTVRMWWNGVKLGTATGTYTGTYAGTDPGALLGTNWFNLTTDAPTDIFSGYSTVSDLRYYEGQTV